MNPKPLGHPAYGSIPHLLGSRRGPADHGVSPEQAAILTKKVRDRHDLIIVQEKLDGSNCSVAKVEGEIVALGRAGYLAETSPYAQHRYFARWVAENAARFDRLLLERERVSGEWLAQAHGTRYDLPHEPFVPFDLLVGTVRSLYHDFLLRVLPLGLLCRGCCIWGKRFPSQKHWRRLRHRGTARWSLLRVRCGAASGEAKWILWLSMCGKERWMGATFRSRMGAEWWCGTEM